EQFLNFVVAQGFRKSFPSPGQRQVLRDVGWQKFLGFGKTVKRPQGGNLQVNALAAEPALGILRFTGELAVALVLEKSHQVPQLDRFPIVQTLLGGPTNKLFEQGGVSALSMLR